MKGWVVAWFLYSVDLIQTLLVKQTPLVEKQLSKDWINIMITPPGSFRRHLEFHWLIPWLDQQPDDVILDVGCGDGTYTSYINEQAQKVFGIDVEIESVRAASCRKADNCSYCVAAAEFLPFSKRDTFDKAVGICAMEHFNDDVRALREIRRLIKDGGILTMSVDSLSNRDLTIKYLAEHRVKYNVNNYYSEESLRRKLKQAGFLLNQTMYVVSSPIGLALYRLCESSKWFDYLPHKFPSLMARLMLLLDRMNGKTDEGYKLCFSATAV